ncbi:RHS repeat-associated core domain-containing protein [Ralstonia pseudosolanacearum]|uniref:RHS repeat-associated core domain-containing protein n=1 Tax=Ralstonia pseudosolanacearum TaxID=1310165 RepID=UPI00339A5110
MITDTNNLMVWRWDQADPFGAMLPDENPTSLGSFTYNLRFPGQVYDAETGKHYNVNRDYDPASGRYVQSDPIGLDGGQPSTYAYVNGNPTSYADPLGLTPAGAAIGGRIGGWAGGALGEIIDPVGGGVPGAAIGSALGGAAGDWISDAIASKSQDSNTSSSTDTGKVCKPAKSDVQPNDLCEQFALAEAKAGAGYPIMGQMGDEPRLIALYGPGPWIKKQHTHIFPNGRKVVIHYFSNNRGKNVELKFK